MTDTPSLIRVPLSARSAPSDPPSALSAVSDDPSALLAASSDTRSPLPAPSDDSQSALSALSEQNLARLARTLLRSIELVLNAHDYITDIPINSVLPWIVLYRVLRYVEVYDPGAAPPMAATDDDEDSPCLPSLALLVSAHELLGRRGWCMTGKGELLLFIVRVMMSELSRGGGGGVGEEHPCKEELELALEQCFYCLYGHPNKKGRAPKHLDDHNTTTVSVGVLCPCRDVVPPCLQVCEFVSL